jgi:hypothetical protein
MFKIIFILTIIMLMSFVSADTQVDETTVFSTLGGDFNYTFSEQMNFTVASTYSDRVMLNYTNISIIPYSGTGNATIYQVTEDYIKFIVCCNQNVDMSFENLTTGMDVYITEDDLWYPDTEENITFNAAGCKEIIIENSYTSGIGIEFINPTDSDNTRITRNWSYVNTSVTNGVNSTSLIDWNNSLVGWWKFNSNTDFTDHSTNNNDATNYGSTYVIDGKFGGARDFDGTNDYVEKDVQLVSGYPFTLDAWSKSGVEHYGTLIGFVDKSEEKIVYGISHREGKCALTSRNVSFYTVLSTTDCDDSEWHYVVGVFYSDIDKRLYVDGVNEANLTTSSIYNSGVDRYSIGRYGDNTPGNLFNGTIDEVKIYNRALSEEEINASYNAGLYRLYHNFTGLVNGEYRYTVYAQDTDGITASSTKRFTVVDEQEPVYPQATVLFRNLENGENTINIIYKETSWVTIAGGIIAGAVAYTLLRRRRRR